MAGDSKPTLTYSGKAPPFAVLGAARLAGVDFELAGDPALPRDFSPVLLFSNGEDLVGTPTILRYVARLAAESPSAPDLYGPRGSAVAAAQVDQWIDASASLAPGSGLAAACAALGEAAASRTFLVGDRLTAADLAAWGQLQGNLQWDGVRKADLAGSKGGATYSAIQHLGRWYDWVDGDETLKALGDELGPRRRFTTPKPTKVANLGADAGGGAVGSFDVDIGGDPRVGEVVTRFPPEPSGYLHVGHAKAALLNRHIADMYKGQMRVRFDDTNPSKEKDEYTTSILQDIKRLGVRVDGEVTYTSDYFAQLEDCARRMLAAGTLYADDTPVERMRAERMDGIPSARRGSSPAESTAAFEEMLRGSEEGLRWCLRVKLDMSDPNKALRDPVAYRCNLTPHWRTGDAHKAYPTYDFACPFVDAYEGVTHALRTSEYKDREAQFYRILDLQRAVWPSLPPVSLWDYARLSFVNTVLSKRKLTWFVEHAVVDGWDDPRMPTVQGILRRGLQVPALKAFILQQGASKNNTTQEWDKIWTMNKKLIDPVCPRHTAVEDAGRARVVLENWGQPGSGTPEDGSVEVRLEVPSHAKNPDAGTKVQVRRPDILIDATDALAVAEGEEVTLMGWGNAIFGEESVDRDGADAVAALGAARQATPHEKGSTPDDDTTARLIAAHPIAIRAALNPGGDFKKTKLKLTWLADCDDLVPLRLHSFGHLIDKKKLEEDDVFEDHVNYESRTITAAHGDPSMARLRKGDIIQLERKGFYVVDSPLEQGKPMVLLNIPDGRTKNMA